MPITSKQTSSAPGSPARVGTQPPAKAPSERTVITVLLAHEFHYDGEYSVSVFCSFFTETTALALPAGRVARWRAMLRRQGRVPLRLVIFLTVADSFGHRLCQYRCPLPRRSRAYMQARFAACASLCKQHIRIRHVRQHWRIPSFRAWGLSWEAPGSWATAWVSM
jgi:hypothetical protein